MSFRVIIATITYGRMVTCVRKPEYNLKHNKEKVLWGVWYVFYFSCSSSQVFLSTRSGAWVLSRSSGGGYPFNMMLTRRCNNFITRVLPSCFINWSKQKRLNHENYGLSVVKGYICFYFMGDLRFVFTVFTHICKVHMSVEFHTYIEHLLFKTNLLFFLHPSPWYLPHV